MRRYMLGCVLGITSVVAGCIEKNPRDCQDGTCTDAKYPFCDTDGAFGEAPYTCVAVACFPSEFAGCRGDESLTCSASGETYDVAACDHGCSDSNRGCNACTPDSSACVGTDAIRCGTDGQSTVMESCQHGCVETPVAHCTYLEPKYLTDACETQASLGDLSIAADETFDTSSDVLCTSVVDQTGGPPLCVIRRRSFKLALGASVAVTGTRGFALIVDNELSIEGRLSVSAIFTKNGPGGGSTASGGFVTGGNGQGGAGFRTPGGSGGNATTDGGAANAGAALPDPALFSALIGGPHSGAPGIIGGGGGGAATLISCRGTVMVSGQIDANGGGGAAGVAPLGTLLGAGGGGAGGNVVLQGLQVEVTGKLYANGGGGGAGKPSDQAEGAIGNDGYYYETPAPGGTGQSGGGSGGAGGSRTAAPRNGARSTIAGASGGGGGGSVGYFQTYTPAGVTPTLTPSVASPPLQPNGTVQVR